MSSTRQRSGSLTDTHLVILSAAAQRNDRCLARPERMAQATFARAIKQLLTRGLLEELDPKEVSPHGPSGEPPHLTLRITAAGLTAIGVDPDLKSATGHDDQPPRRSRKRRADRATEEPASPAPTTRSPATGGAPGASELGPYRPGTKRALILALLCRKGGASIAI